MHVELKYDLTRRQRLIPHVRAWGFAQVFLLPGIIAIVAAVVTKPSWTLVIPSLLILWFVRRYLVGVFNVLLKRRQKMDIVIEDSGLGFMIGTERFYVFLDGLTAVRDLESSVWTVQHWNGTVVNIPKKILPDDALEFLRDWVCRANEIRDEHGIRSPHPTKPTKA